jgi:hypothetical protein
LTTLKKLEEDHLKLVQMLDEDPPSSLSRRLSRVVLASVKQLVRFYVEMLEEAKASLVQEQAEERGQTHA